MFRHGARRPFFRNVVVGYIMLSEPLDVAITKADLVPGAAEFPGRRQYLEFDVVHMYVLLGKCLLPRRALPYTIGGGIPAGAVASHDRNRRETVVRALATANSQALSAATKTTKSKTKTTSKTTTTISTDRREEEGTSPRPSGGPNSSERGSASGENQNQNHTPIRISGRAPLWVAENREIVGRGCSPTDKVRAYKARKICARAALLVALALPPRERDELLRAFELLDRKHGAASFPTDPRDGSDHEVTGEAAARRTIPEGVAEFYEDVEGLIGARLRDMFPRQIEVSEALHPRRPNVVAVKRSAIRRSSAEADEEASSIQNSPKPKVTLRKSTTGGRKTPGR